MEWNVLLNYCSAQWKAHVISHIHSLWRSIQNTISCLLIATRLESFSKHLLLPPARTPPQPHFFSLITYHGAARMTKVGPECSLSTSRDAVYQEYTTSWRKKKPIETNYQLGTCSIMFQCAILLLAVWTIGTGSSFCWNWCQNWNPPCAKLYNIICMRLHRKTTPKTYASWSITTASAQPSPHSTLLCWLVLPRFTPPCQWSSRGPLERYRTFGPAWIFFEPGSNTKSSSNLQSASLPALSSLVQTPHLWRLT